MTFEAVNSHRLRGGTRLAYAVSEQVSPYVGAAYEYEFDGKAGASVYGLPVVDAPSVKGGTGIAELGLNLKPNPDSPVPLDLGVQGYTGKREGVSPPILYVSAITTLQWPSSYLSQRTSV
jgi:hypothetical protein